MIALIGVDCATQPKNVGLALGFARSGGVDIVACRTGSPDEPPAWIVRQWLARHKTTLIALDAPLGWATPLGNALAGHQAGKPVEYDADALFRRATDVSIRIRFAKKPLEVGADLISRTAVAALKLLDEIADDGSATVPLAWRPDELAPISAIEVYPAATRLARDAPDKGGSFDGLTTAITLASELHATTLSRDAVDAMVCVLAAADFVEGRSMGPDDLESAHKEGWIWAPSGRGCLSAR